MISNPTGLPKQPAYGKWFPPEEIQFYDSSRIIEIGIILVKNKKVVSTYNSIVKPDTFTTLAPKITELTGITEQKILEEGKDFVKLLKKLNHFSNKQLQLIHLISGLIKMFYYQNCIVRTTEVLLND